MCSPYPPIPNKLSSQLEACRHPSHLTQLHAHLLRSHLLLSNPTPPFHHLNSLMRSYLRLSLPIPSLSLLPLLLRFGIRPDNYTLPIVLKAAAALFSLPLARHLHALALRLGLARHEFSESALVSVYSKSGEFRDARRVFDENPHRGLATWNALLNGLAQGGYSAEVLEMFVRMMRAGSVVPDGFTMVGVVSACGSLGGIALAEQVHKCVLQVKVLERLDVMLSNALVDMYCKCGRTDLAQRVFAKMEQRDVSTWTSMIMGLAMHGQERSALQFFETMRQEGVQPNHVTMVAVLSACTHGALVEEGMEYFEKMKLEYDLEPTVAHYGCVVDMLGRVGRVEEAEKVVDKMPMEANVVVWGALLGACEKYAKVAVGERAAAKLVELEPWNDGVYVVLSNIYASSGMWVEVERARRLMKGRRVGKIPGYSLAGSET